jgi:hypothetical protein
MITVRTSPVDTLGLILPNAAGGIVGEGKIEQRGQITSSRNILVFAKLRQKKTFARCEFRRVVRGWEKCGPDLGVGGDRGTIGTAAFHVTGKGLFRSYPIYLTQRHQRFLMVRSNSSNKSASRRCRQQQHHRCRVQQQGHRQNE